MNHNGQGAAAKAERPWLRLAGFVFLLALVLGLAGLAVNTYLTPPAPAVLLSPPATQTNPTPLAATATLEAILPPTATLAPPTEQPLPTAAPLPAAGPLKRLADPVVLTGAELPDFVGMEPGMLTAWRYEGNWVQIPVQVDERAQVDIGQVRKDALNRWQLKHSQVLLYTDPGTLTGPDPDATLDVDDEVVFLARDAGPEAPAGATEPAGVVSGSGTALSLTDPASGLSAWVYLFKQAGGLEQSAGKAYVDYQFKLLSGDYLTTYQFEKGNNPEDTRVITPGYEQHFSDRWVADALRILTPGASGVNILDQQKIRLAPDNCDRTENTFSRWGGGFVVNKSGPVRAIRSYIGANSGRYTQRTNLFYDYRQDIISDIRVHEIPGLVDFFDYSPEAAGMTYANNLNLAGVTIDGMPDQVITGTLQWELSSGPQGALVMLFSLDSDIPNLVPSSYYMDDKDPWANAKVRCTGDQFSYGASGPWLNFTIPNTDPVRGKDPKNLRLRRVIYFMPPTTAVNDAQALFAASSSPLVIAVKKYKN